MTMNLMTKEIAYKALQDFFSNNSRPFVLFGTGTSCALDVRFGMDMLKECLLVEIPKKELNSDQLVQWDSVVKALACNNNLESAMNCVHDDSLTHFIVQCTGEFVASLDKEYSARVLSGTANWPPIQLFKRLVKGLPETDRALHVATPNYDLLAEYAFEQAAIPYTTGYVGGVCRNLNWNQAEFCWKYYEEIPKGKKVKKSLKSRKHARLYKVHGSLNTFKINNRPVENNSWIYEAPFGIERMMVTPGTSKYEKLHDNRYEQLHEYDKAVINHDAFLFIGFGFNDNQLCTASIKQKLIDQKCQGLIITRDTNDRIAELAGQCDNLWLVCKHGGNGNDGTRIFNARYDDWLYLDDKKLWDTKEFTEEILGG